MTDTRLVDMTPDDLRRNWERDHSTCHLWTHVRGLVQRATREAREGIVPKYRLDATIRELLVMTDYWREAMAQRDEARTQLTEAESTIAALREQVAEARRFPWGQFSALECTVADAMLSCDTHITQEQADTVEREFADLREAFRAFLAASPTEVRDGD
jgi:hypothetical protein